MRVVRQIFGKKLKGNEAAELGIFSLVNDAQPAAAEDAVV
jgi:hypothetical protein